MSDFNWDAFTAEAEKDNRLGKQMFVITDVVHDTWNDGRARHKFRGVLATAGNAKCDLTLNDPPTADEAKEAQAAGDAKRMRGIAFSYKNHETLAKYGKSVTTLAEGDEIRVEVTKDKEGFVRAQRILPPDAMTQTSSGAGGPGF